MQRRRRCRPCLLRRCPVSSDTPHRWLGSELGEVHGPGSVPVGQCRCKIVPAPLSGQPHQENASRSRTADCIERHAVVQPEVVAATCRRSRRSPS
jgi:hypothetical protein